MKKGIENKRKRPKAELEFSVTEPSGLLEFLLLKFHNRSRNHVKSLLTHREVLVDGNVVTKYDYQLSKGQTIRVIRSQDRGLKQKDALQIVYEDHDLIVINKPAGLLSIATDEEKDLTAYHLLTDHVRRSDSNGRVFIVHRLDRDTSGVLLFAKNERMKLALQDHWGTIVSKRGYIAVVEGQLKDKNGRIRSWLKETKTLLMYSSQKAGDGLEAITNYQVIREGKTYSLINIQLETGRKNQIRVHMKELGHPVVGDKKYGAQTNPLKRLGLHANRLEIIHPFSKELLCFESEIPPSFKTLLKA